MSAVPAAPAAAAAPDTRLALYRDDGPLAIAIGRIGMRLPVPGIVLLLAAAAPLVALLATHGEDPPRGALGAALGWAVLAGGLSSGRPQGGRFDWAVPTVLRMVEYGTFIWLAAIGPGAAQPAVYAFLCAIAFRQYDIVYRVRHRSEPPPAWITTIGGGWDGRLLVAYALLLLDALPAGLFLAAAALAVVSVTESARGWARQSARGLSDDDDDETP